MSPVLNFPLIYFPNFTQVLFPRMRSPEMPCHSSNRANLSGILSHKNAEIRAETPTKKSDFCFPGFIHLNSVGDFLEQITPISDLNHIFLGLLSLR
jgi:hypothetical protein